MIFPATVSIRLSPNLLRLHRQRSDFASLQFFLTCVGVGEKIKRQSCEALPFFGDRGNYFFLAAFLGAAFFAAFLGAAFFAGAFFAGAFFAVAIIFPFPLDLVSVVLLAFIAGESGLCAAELAGRRPNIILVMTDDQGYGDLACHGNPIIQTPHIDRLHAGSVRFTDFQVSPTCAPT